MKRSLLIVDRSFTLPARLPGVAALMLLLAPALLLAQPRVTAVEATWEDSLAVVLPSIEEPIAPSLRRTLNSGVPVIVDIEVRFTRTGFVKNELIPVKVEYDVWTDWYRVHTPLTPLAIEAYETVERLFQRDLVLLFDEGIVDPDETWGVKVRAGTRIAEDDAGNNNGGRSGVEEDLSGFTRFLFRLFGSGPEMSDWSDLERLPKRADR